MGTDLGGAEALGNEEDSGGGDYDARGYSWCFSSDPSPYWDRLVWASGPSHWAVCFFFERGLICFCISKKGVEYVQRDLQELKAQKKSGSFRCLCCACIIVDTLFSDMLNLFLPHFCMRLS